MKVLNKIWVITLLFVFIFIAGCDFTNSPEPPSAETAAPTVVPEPTVAPTSEPPQIPINLGTAGNFAILAGSAITNTGATIVNGDIALSPGFSVTGFPPGTLNGIPHIADATAATAIVDLATALTDAAGLLGATLVATELGGTTLTYGLYNSAAGDFSINGTLTLNGQGDPNAIFIFQAASTLTTGTGSSIVLTNGAQAQNVFWYVGSSATLGTSSTFIGTILAQASITVTTGATIDGKVLAHDGAVTLDTNIITKTP